jgi:hypothetical protein
MATEIGQYQMTTKYIFCFFIMVASSEYAKANDACEQSALIIPKQTAEFIINDSIESKIIFSVKENSDSLAVQLYFWMYLLGKDENLVKLGEMDLLHLLKRNDDGINSVIWLAFHDPGFEVFFNIKKHAILESLNNWFRNFQEKNLLGAINILLEANRLYSGIVKLDGLDKHISDKRYYVPHWNIDLAEANRLSDKPNEAYSFLKRAAENGALVFFDLGTYEHSVFIGCEERASFSFAIHRASRPWIKKLVL